MLNTIYLTALVLLTINYSSAQSTADANVQEAEKAIAESNTLYFQAYAKNDVTLFASLYAEDCWIMAPNMPTLCGPEAPNEFFENAYHQLSIRNGKFITIDVYGITGDIVAEIGFWKWYHASSTEFDDGKFIVLWKKTPHGWKRWRDSFNSNPRRK